MKKRGSGKPQGMDLIAHYQAKIEAGKEAARQTFTQYMADMFILALNDPDVMGKDVFGYERIQRVIAGVGKNYDTYFDALTKTAEADYARSKLDIEIFRIMKGSSDFKTFEQRYYYLPEIRYELRK